MPYHITLIPGDGIGEEVTQSAMAVLKAAGVQIEWDKQLAGLSAIEAGGSALPKSTIQSIRNNRVCLKGPTTTPVGGGHRSANVMLRQELDLYACIRPVKSLAGVKTRFENVDLVIFRENTEGLYSGQEMEITTGIIISMKIATRAACTRISEEAFAYARRHKRKKVTAVHKANILKLGDGLFLKCALEVAAKYPEITYDSSIVDATCMRMVMNPETFDVLLLENLYGDILSDLCAGLVGGLGVVPGANIGKEGAIFEAVHGSAPDIAGRNLANPTAILKSAAMMLDYLGETSKGQAIDGAVNRVLEEGKVRTGDLGGTATTTDFTKAVISALF